ncbi:hypothetical protein F383_37539 [Gossypium arboreum]|uniref:Uncharacterized protein n=1 Tax=Gossypium arboreum TaxID=29729 RepID=A0A0B0MDK2_GOSAR|nr:hypothetical protein F383_37539 [Gossypium arboreum]
MCGTQPWYIDVCGHFEGPCGQVSFDHGLDTRACLMAVWISQHVCSVLPRLRHTGVSNAV